MSYMKPTQVLRKELQTKKGTRDKYMDQLKEFNNQARDKQGEIDRLEAEIKALNEAITILGE